MRRLGEGDLVPVTNAFSIPEDDYPPPRLGDAEVSHIDDGKGHVVPDGGKIIHYHVDDSTTVQTQESTDVFGHEVGWLFLFKDSYKLQIQAIPAIVWAALQVGPREALAGEAAD